jgi:hypothetical protein
MGPLQEGDQAIVDILQHLPNEDVVYQTQGEAVVNSFTGNRETTPGLQKDHWSVAYVETDEGGNPKTAEVSLLTVSSKDIDVVLRGGDIDTEIRTEEDKPKAIDRAKLHSRDVEQSIKLLTAERLNKAAGKIALIQAQKKNSED